ncbi:MAG TPA: hypothetical protein VIW68_06495 [Candidatus Sulfotelmatobacter sp.]
MRIRVLPCCFSFLLFFTALSAAQSAGQDTSFNSGPQYLLTGSPLLARSLATPSLSLDVPLSPVPSDTIPVPESSAGVPYTTNPELAHQADLIPIYYGEPNYYRVPEASVVELSFPEGATAAPAALSASIAEDGVTQFIDPQVLRVQGIDVPLGDVAAYWKTHKPLAQRNYTNEDVKRLHSAG